MNREKQPPLDKPSDRDLLDAILSIPGSTGDTYSRFYNYSQRNIGFLAMQGCPPEPVATYTRWQELNRQVVRGQKAYSILRPIQIKIQDEEEDEPRYIQRFKSVRSLFSYSQTTGEELERREPREWSLQRALGELAIRQVRFESYDGNTGGYAFDRNIAINPMAPNPVRTAAHEIAHIDLGHTTNENINLYHAHRGTFEAEAESTAHLVLKEIDELDEKTASVSRGYIQGWLRDGELSDKSVQRILSSSSRIVAAGYEKEQGRESDK